MAQVVEAQVLEKKPSRWRWNVVALIVGLLFLAPFFWLVLTAFERYGGLNLTGGGGFTFSNFSSLFGKTAAAKDIGEGVGGSLLNSIWLSAGTMIITTVVALIAGYPLSRFNIPGRNAIVYAIVFVTGLPILAIVIPTYDIFVTYNLVDSLPWTILFLTATSLPFAVWLAKNFIDTVPLELEAPGRAGGRGDRVLHVHPGVGELLRAVHPAPVAQAARRGDHVPVLRRALDQLQRPRRLLDRVHGGPGHLLRRHLQAKWR